LRGFCYTPCPECLAALHCVPLRRVALMVRYQEGERVGRADRANFAIRANPSKSEVSEKVKQSSATPLL
jgi:hypothetical protein